MTSPRSIRIYPELRAVHVERDDAATSAETWYFRTNGLTAADVPAHFRRVRVGSAALRLFRTGARVVEVPEPLWARFLPTDLVLMAAARLGAALRRRSVRVCTYALENNTPDAALFGDALPAVVRRIGVRVLGAVVGRLVDRIAFGSDGAAASYRALGVAQRVESRTFAELPAASDSPAEAEPGSVVFVGALEARKGVPQLLRAWGRVATPGARLTIVGSGPLADTVAVWAAEDPVRRRFLGAIDHAAVLDVVRTAAVVVAPSVRDGRWREQIGLPIKEGLAAGATIVTTAETGLAEWLTAGGHSVLDPAALDEALASAITRALDAPLPRAAVRAALPAADGRLVADRWLHAG